MGAGRLVPGGVPSSNDIAVQFRSGTAGHGSCRRWAASPLRGGHGRQYPRWAGELRHRPLDTRGSRGEVVADRYRESRTVAHHGEQAWRMGSTVVLVACDRGSHRASLGSVPCALRALRCADADRESRAVCGPVVDRQTLRCGLNARKAPGGAFRVRCSVVDQRPRVQPAVQSSEACTAPLNVTLENQLSTAEGSTAPVVSVPTYPFKLALVVVFP